MALLRLFVKIFASHAIPAMKIGDQNILLKRMNNSSRKLARISLFY